MWKLESDEDFFRIYDSKKLITGYFDPDYGPNIPKNNAEEFISSMLKNRDIVLGGIVMVPLLKFCLFDTDLNTTLANVEEQVNRVSTHIQKWKAFMSATSRQAHSVRISHTDQDMLTIAFQVRFSKPTPLDEKLLAAELFPVLDLLEKSDLL